MIFDDLDCVKYFVGNDYEKSYVPEEARNILKRYDNRSKHFKILYELIYN